jgi:hypothetical protein
LFRWCSTTFWEQSPSLSQREVILEARWQFNSDKEPGNRLGYRQARQSELRKPPWHSWKLNLKDDQIILKRPCYHGSGFFKYPNMQHPNPRNGEKASCQEECELQQSTNIDIT